MDAPAGAVIGVPGKTRRRGGLAARKEEQRRMARRARCWQVHGALTHEVNPIEAVNARFPAAWQGMQSGQLLFPG
ncbi:hypothetical protein PY257_05130 [Ramlibacter sp. H39-3-26]|nr:hypothetical protein [Ramlibacter sp. H39-3-26]